MMGEEVLGEDGVIDDDVSDGAFARFAWQGFYEEDVCSHMYQPSQV